MDVESDRARVQLVGLVRLSGAPSPRRCPACVDLEDDFAARDQVASETPSVAPRALYADPPLTPEASQPLPEALPAALTVGAAPAFKLAPLLVKRHGHVNSFVSIDSHCDHYRSPLI
jgi:hypothetical protein